MNIVDTDVMIDVFRGLQPAVDWLNSLENEEILLPGYVAMELFQGCEDKEQRRKVENNLNNFSIKWPSPEVCNRALSNYSKYNLSHSLGMIDALIGQLSVSLDLPLYTFNEKHYEVIPDLKTVQPYQKE